RLRHRAGWCHHAIPAPHSESFECRGQTGYRTRYPSRERTDDGPLGLVYAIREKLLRSYIARGLLAIVECVSAPPCLMKEHEAAPAEIARLRVCHGERKRGCNRGIDCIAALTEHSVPDRRGLRAVRHNTALV